MLVRAAAPCEMGIAAIHIYTLLHFVCGCYCCCPSSVLESCSSFLNFMCETQEDGVVWRATHRCSCRIRRFTHVQCARNENEQRTHTDTRKGRTACSAIIVIGERCRRSGDINSLLLFWKCAVGAIECRKWWECLRPVHWVLRLLSAAAPFFIDRFFHEWKSLCQKASIPKEKKKPFFLFNKTFISDNCSRDYVFHVLIAYYQNCRCAIAPCIVWNETTNTASEFFVPSLNAGRMNFHCKWVSCVQDCWLLPVFWADDYVLCHCLL